MQSTCNGWLHSCGSVSLAHTFLFLPVGDLYVHCLLDLVVAGDRVIGMEWCAYVYFTETLPSIRTLTKPIINNKQFSYSRCCCWCSLVSVSFPPTSSAEPWVVLPTGALVYPMSDSPIGRRVSIHRRTASHRAFHGIQQYSPIWDWERREERNRICRDWRHWESQILLQ